MQKRFKTIRIRFDEEQKHAAALLLLGHLIEHPEELDELDEEFDGDLLVPVQEPVSTRCSGSGRFCVWIPEQRTWEHPLCPGCPSCEWRRNRL